MDLHAILDQIDEIIYISDIETNELLYLNRSGHNLFGTIPPGAKCYEFLQGQESPCQFCTNGLLKNSTGHRCSWVRQHPTVGNMLLHDSLIEYNGRLCRMEMAVDVNRYAEELLEARLDLADEKKLVSCIEDLVMSADFDIAVESVLETIIEHYAADRAYVFEIDWDNDVTHNTYEVCREGVTPEKQNLQNLPIAVVAVWIDIFQNRQKKINIIEDVDALKDDPARRIEYDCLHPQGIKSLITVPVFISGRLYGFLGVDNPKANADAPELLTQITYIAANELQKRRLTENLTEKSYRDPLTGLQNRLAYDEALVKLKGPAIGQGIGVGFVDLNGLKYLNDTLGHEHGNKAIQRVCAVMRDNFELEMLYRVSGDEFIVLWPDVDYAVFSYVSRALDKRLTEAEGGIAAYGYTWGTAQDDLHALVLEAEQLMIAEKNQYYLENASADKPRPAYLDSLLQEIRASTFIPYLQPLYSIQAGQVYGAEALVRKIGPDGKIHVPVEFLHVLEQEHMISTVDYTILEQVCKLLVQWKDKWSGLKINCNMSRQTLSEPNYLERIDEILARTGVDPAQLTFEVTEGSQNIKMDRLEAILDALRSRGITLAIDDMGTEASCLEMLYLPQIETVKLDRSLICKAEHSQREQTVISSMIDLCHKLDMYCVAEGIETESQVELLRQMHCDRLQGYYIGKPMPPEEFFEKFCPGEKE